MPLRGRPSLLRSVRGHGRKRSEPCAHQKHPPSPSSRAIVAAGHRWMSHAGPLSSPCDARAATGGASCRPGTKPLRAILSARSLEREKARPSCEAAAAELPGPYSIRSTGRGAGTESGGGTQEQKGRALESRAECTASRACSERASGVRRESRSWVRGSGSEGEQPSAASHSSARGHASARTRPTSPDEGASRRKSKFSALDGSRRVVDRVEEANSSFRRWLWEVSTQRFVRAREWRKPAARRHGPRRKRMGRGRERAGDAFAKVNEREVTLARACDRLPCSPSDT